MNFDWKCSQVHSCLLITILWELRTWNLSTVIAKSASRCSLQLKRTVQTWRPVSKVFFFFFQFCDVAEVTIIHKMI
jgi:hypothetical protein